MENHTSETGSRLFAWLRSTGLTRPEGGWAGGVLAGLSEKLGWDASLVRGLGAVAFIIFFSPAALLYGLAWLLLPDRDGEIHAQQAVRGSYTSGFYGSALLAVVGALNIFTPISIAGPLAVVINVVIIAAVAWLVVALAKNQRGDSKRTWAGRAAGSPAGTTGTSETPDAAGTTSSTGTTTDAGTRGPGKGPAGDSKPPRADGKPAWYPRETGEQPPSQAYPSASSVSSPNSSAVASAAAPAGARQERSAGPSPAERVERRRRRQLTWGVALLAAPLIIGLAWFSGGFGLSALTVALVAVAVLVVLLALGHIVAALRGRAGAPGLLALCTAVMLVLFAGHGSDGGFAQGSNHAFGNYTTTESEVNSVFSNTTLDLRQLTETASSEQMPQDSATLNTAFSNATVIVPDDTRVLISNGQAMSSLDIATQQDHFTQAGLSGEDIVLGPAEADREITLALNSAFANTTVYDATTYEQEAGEAR